MDVIKYAKYLSYIYKEHFIHNLSKIFKGGQN